MNKNVDGVNYVHDADLNSDVISIMDDDVHIHVDMNNYFSDIMFKR